MSSVGVVNTNCTSGALYKSVPVGLGFATTCFIAIVDSSLVCVHSADYTIF